MAYEVSQAFRKYLESRNISVQKYEKLSDREAGRLYETFVREEWGRSAPSFNRIRKQLTVQAQKKIQAEVKRSSTEERKLGTEYTNYLRRNKIDPQKYAQLPTSRKKELAETFSNAVVQKKQGVVKSGPSRRAIERAIKVVQAEQEKIELKRRAVPPPEFNVEDEKRALRESTRISSKVPPPEFDVNEEKKQLRQAAEAHARANEPLSEVDELLKLLFGEDGTGGLFGGGGSGGGGGGRGGGGPTFTNADVENQMAQLRNLTKEYVVKIPDQDLRGWATRMLSGKQGMDSFETHLKQMAKGRWPGLSKAIDEGQTPNEYLATYRAHIADELDRSAADIDFNDPRFGRILEQVDKDGAKRAMNIDEAITYVRTLPEWSQTKRANQAAAEVGENLLRLFGKVG